MNDRNNAATPPIGPAGSFLVGAAIGAGGLLLAAGLLLPGGALLSFISGVAGAVAGASTGSLALGIAVGSAGIAAVGYGAYRAVRAAYRAVKNNSRLDKTWTLAGAITGAVGLLLAPLPGGEPETGHRLDRGDRPVLEESHYDTDQGAFRTADLGAAFRTQLVHENGKPAAALIKYEPDAPAPSAQI